MLFSVAGVRAVRTCSLLSRTAQDEMMKAVRSKSGQDFFQASLGRRETTIYHYTNPSL